MNYIYTYIYIYITPNIPDSYGVKTGPNKSTHNEIEVYYAVDLAKRYGDAGVPLKYVAIVTPYKSQSRLLMHYLHRSGLSEVAVSSLDAFQGDERTVIIFSFAGTEGPGFMADPRRLLVSMTRAVTSVAYLLNYERLSNPENGTRSRRVQMLAQSASKVLHLAFLFWKRRKPQNWPHEDWRWIRGKGLTLHPFPQQCMWRGGFALVLVQLWTRFSFWASASALVKASIQQEVNKQKLRSQEWEIEQVAYIEKMGELNTSCNEKDTRINAR